MNTCIVDRTVLVAFQLSQLFILGHLHHKIQEEMESQYLPVVDWQGIFFYESLCSDDLLIYSKRVREDSLPSLISTR